MKGCNSGGLNGSVSFLDQLMAGACYTISHPYSQARRGESLKKIAQKAVFFEVSPQPTLPSSNSDVPI